MKILKASKIWFEIVVLVIPTKNDSPEEIEGLCRWIADHLSDSAPIHFTRFHPVYKIKDLPSTPHATLRRAHAQAREAGLSFPYVGNVQGGEGEDTICPHCHERVIVRRGFYVVRNGLVKGHCPRCEKPIPGVWN